MTEKLKPCPFCGGEAKVEEMFTKYYARCSGCWAGGSLRGSYDEAVAAWNRRVKAKELVVSLNVSDEQVRQMVDEAVSAAIDNCMGQIREAVGL